MCGVAVYLGWVNWECQLITWLHAHSGGENYLSHDICSWGLPSHQIGANSARFPPEDGRWGGGNGLGPATSTRGYPKILQGSQKAVKIKRGYPLFLGTFWRFLGISGENGVPYWPPRESKPADKTVHPSGVISEVLPRAHFVLLASRAQIGSRTSGIAPEGRCAVFSASLDSLGGQDCTPFSPEIPKISKKCPK